MSATRILIVDDHQLAREGLRAVLEQSGFEIAGVAGTGEEAVAMAGDLAPDVILMDVRLGDGIDGLEATRQIVALGLPSKVIMLSLHDMPGYVREALAAGAAGYVLKDTAIGDLRVAIDQVMAGQSALPLSLVNAALQSGDDTRSAGDLDQLLTGRERQVLDHICEGKTNKEIGRALDISPATVKVHVERIIAKLGAADRTHAAVMAVQIRSSAA